MKTSYKTKLKRQVNAIVKTLKSEGRYTPLLHLQAEHTATLLLMVEQMRDEILSFNTPFVEITTSREGNERAKQSPLYQLFAQYMDRLQDSLKALGMNVDAKEVKKESKGIEEFINKFNDD